MAPFFQYSYSQRLCFFSRDISWVGEGLQKICFVRFEQALNGVVFDRKISAGNRCAFAGERFKLHKIRFFSTRVLGDTLKDWFRVTEHPAAAFCLVYFCMKVPRFYCQVFFAWSDES